MTGITSKLSTILLSSTACLAVAVVTTGPAQARVTRIAIERQVSPRV